MCVCMRVCVSQDVYFGAGPLHQQLAIGYCKFGTGTDAQTRYGQTITITVPPELANTPASHTHACPLEVVLLNVEIGLQRRGA
jgi:hypothetical protein